MIAFVVDSFLIGHGPQRIGLPKSVKVPEQAEVDRRHGICSGCEWFLAGGQVCRRPRTSGFNVCPSSAGRFQPWRRLAQCDLWK
jgi:hypothetical protein